MLERSETQKSWDPFLPGRALGTKRAVIPASSGIGPQRQLASASCRAQIIPLHPHIPASVHGTLPWARCHVTLSPAHMANLCLPAEPEQDTHGQPEYVDVMLIDVGQCRQVTMSPFCLPRWTVESSMSVNSSEGPLGSSTCGILHVVSLSWLHHPPHPHSPHYVPSKLFGHLDYGLGLCIPRETGMRPSLHLSSPDSGP